MWRSLSFWLLLCVGALCAPAHATTLCVNNNADLYTAISGAVAAAPDTPYVIQLQQGNYQFFQRSGAVHAQFTLEGGYSPGCGSRTVNAANTQIDFGGNGFLDFTVFNDGGIGKVSIDGVTLKHGAYLELFGGLFDCNFCSDDAGYVTLSNTRISNFSSSQRQPLRLGSVKGAIGLTNVLIDHMYYNQPGDGCSVDLFAGDDADITLNFATVDPGNGKQLCFSAGGGGSNSVQVINSIVWNSDGTYSVIRSDPTAGNDVSVYLHGSLFFDTKGSATFVKDGTNLFGNPKFVDPVNGNYTLQPASPAVNKGSSVDLLGIPARDIAGNGRSTGSHPDAGAFESAIDDTLSFVVTNTNSSGAGSLRQAILNANQLPDVNTITFQLPCPSVIALNAPLQVTSPMLIDGYSNPNATTNNDPNAFNANLCVILREQTYGSVLSALQVGGGVDVGIRGLAFDGFYQPVSITYNTDGDVVVSGNQFGGSVGGQTLSGPLLDAVYVDHYAGGDLVIGGAFAGERNVIVGGGGPGVLLDTQETSTYCHVLNNLIGLDRDGSTTLGNQYGIKVAGNSCEIANNRITGNGQGGIWVTGKFNNVHGNLLGLTSQGNAALSGGYAILVDGSNNTIGAPANAGYTGYNDGNAISFMSGGGIRVRQGQYNSVRGNLSSFNGINHDGAMPDLALEDQGLHANDSGDADMGANNLQNFPVGDSLGLPQGLPTNGQVSALFAGHLDSAANASFRIDIYYAASCGKTGRGHAEWYLDSKLVTTTGTTGAFSLPLTLPKSPVGSALSMTATDGQGNTSELGTCFPVDRIFANGVD